MELTQLYNGFKDHLTESKEVKDRVAFLQIVGRIEDYLVKEFTYYVHKSTSGERFCGVNIGKSREQKIDIVIYKGLRPSPTIEALVEAKYFRNRHRDKDKHMDAVDEINEVMKSFNKQLNYIPNELHGGYNICSKQTNIYGLVFASYTRREDDEDKRDEFFNKILNKASNFNFKYHNLDKVDLKPIFENHPVKTLGEEWKVTLRYALWRHVE